MRLIDVVEMDIERCGLSYGAGLCQAALGVTGDRKCYHGIATCQDRVNFDAASPGTPEVPGGSGEFLNVYSSANDFTGTSLTISGVSFGDAAPEGRSRRVLIAVNMIYAGVLTVTGATVGGETATIHAQTGTSHGNPEAYEARTLILSAVPSGTSGSVVLSFSASLSFGRARIASYRLIDAGSTPADTDTSASGDPSSMTLDVPANSYVVAVAQSVGGTGGHAWTGATERYESALGNSSQHAGSGASGTVAAGDATYDVVAENSGSPVFHVAAAVVFKLQDHVPAAPAEKLGTVATWRFVRPTDYVAGEGLEAIPNIEAVRFTPGNIGMGEGLGQRPSLVVTFKDHRWGDTGPNGDPYLAERGFDASRQGTFWGKWRARQPYMRGRAIRWRQGLAGTALADYQTRHFIIESFDGPTPDGRYTVTARDAMQFLASDRSQCPRPSRGNLAAGITSSATSATLVPAGIGDAEYPEDGWLNISGTEIVGFSRTGDTLNLTSGRGLWGTTAVAHEAEARVQLCVDFIADTPADALHRLMTEYGDVPGSAINLDDWQGEVGAFYDGGLLTTLIAEPTPTDKLATDLIREAGLSTWWDDLAGKQRLQVIRAIDTDAMVLDTRYAPGEGNTIAGSLTIKEQPDKRKSRAECWYGQVSPIEGIDKKNLPLLAYRVASDQEVAEGSAEVDTIYSRWIQQGGLVAAAAVTSRRLSRYVRAPRRFTVNIPRWGSLQPQLGQGVQLLLDTHQDEEGNPETVPCQVVGIDPGAQGGAEYGLTLEELRIDPEFAPEFAPNTVIITANALNVNFYQRFTQQYAPPQSGDTATLIINENVVIDSSSISLPALDIGDGWASGVNIVVEFRTNAAVGGRGGDGANGRANEDNKAGFTGGNGGLAFRTTVPVIIKGPGLILAGGGGGGGGGADIDGWFGPQRNGGGGGGGAGWPPGAGGAGAGGSQPGKPGTLLAGGLGGAGGNGSSANPHNGGNGGAPGASGSNAGPYRGGSGGSGGTAIDGWSLVDDSDWLGTITGPTIN